MGLLPPWLLLGGFVGTGPEPPGPPGLGPVGVGPEGAPLTGVKPQSRTRSWASTRRALVTCEEYEEEERHTVVKFAAVSPDAVSAVGNLGVCVLGIANALALSEVVVV